jgi:eukaryotic-like serine/threonine-protein kinase
MGTTSERESVVKTGDMVEGRYRVISTLGAGGMGTVFLAEHALIKRRVAMKLLHADLATDANVVERFMNEARAAGTLGHPNIVESTDMGFTHDHVPYIVFEYLEGTLLTDEIYRVGGMPVRRAVRIAEQIASALQAAHNANIVHRDLKSDNIFLTDKDEALDHVKVLDFGVSRFLELEEAQRNMIVGTPEFMAPEQITSPETVDKRADIYALGVILYEMLTARRPFSNEDDPQQLMTRIVQEAPPPLMLPEIPHALSTIILDKLLAKDPDDRYQTMADVASALEQFLTRGDGTPVPRRRTQPVAVQTGDIPLPKAARETPWPIDTLDGTSPLGMQQVTLPPPPAAKRPYALYGIAGASVIVGAVGLVFGLKGNDAPASAPAPAMASMQAPAKAHEPEAPTMVEVTLASNAPSARVVFRRRAEAAPMKTTIKASDVVELVEVSAPGFKTTRYWLTLDRPTVLNAKLAKGTGSVEATEEETLIALGELSAPTQVAVAPTTKPVAAPAAPAPAAAAPAAAASVKTLAKIAPRKIGRTAAEEPAIEANADASAATPEPDVAPVAAAPVPAPVEPTPAPAPVVTPAPEPAKVAVAPAPAPVVEAPRPAIDRATVSSVVTTHRPEVLKCFSEGKKKNAGLKGTVSVQLQVEPSGKVGRVQVQSTLGAPLVAACVVRSANGWTFPKRSGTEVAMVTYPFTIN